MCDCATREPHPCAMKPRMNGAPMMSLVRETKSWVGHPPTERKAIQSLRPSDFAPAFGRAEAARVRGAMTGPSLKARVT